MQHLASSIYTIPTKNPIVVGSSGLTETAEKIVKIAKAGAGAVVMKSIFEEEIEFQYREEMEKLDKMDSNLEFLDYFDYQLRSNAVTTFCEQIKLAKKKVDIPVVASVSCYTAGEWINFAKPLEEAGADALEVNAFFLPVDDTMSGEDYEDLYVDIITKLKKSLSIPVGIKIGSYFSHLPKFVNRLSKVADGITLFNRFYNPDILLDNNTFTNGHIFSSSSDYNNTLRWIAYLNKKVECTLSASTGIHEPETVVKMLLAGAETTQIVSGLYLHGVQLIPKMLTFLSEYMAKNGYTKLDDFRGAIEPKANSMNHLERVQFMKYFGEASSMIDI